MKGGFDPLRRGKATCCYCKRELTPALPEKSTSFTLDHVKAESWGGFRKVPCCRKCNQLKSDIDMSQWWWFVKNTPRYWKLYDTTEQVMARIRDRIVEMAYENKAKLDALRYGT